MKIPLLIATLFTLSGCATTYTEPTLPADHPANAAGMEAPPPTRWQTLSLAGADPVSPAQSGTGMDHSGHGMGEKAEPKPAEPGMEAGGHKHQAPDPAAGEGATAPYTCPMHAEVTSDKPDQRCPKCGMKLKKQDGGQKP